MAKIYALCDINNNIRYIGKTIGTLEKRLIKHISESKTVNKTHKHRWINSMLKNNIKPTIKLIGNYNENIINNMEMFWIDYFTRLNCNLTNATKGGEGQRATDDTRKKISDKLQGRQLSKTHRKAISEVQMRKVALIDDYGNVEKLYDSIKDTINDGFVASCVGRVCRGERKLHKNKRFIFVM